MALQPLPSCSSRPSGSWRAGEPAEALRTAPRIWDAGTGEARGDLLLGCRLPGVPVPPQTPSRSGGPDGAGGRHGDARGGPAARPSRSPECCDPSGRGGSARKWGSCYPSGWREARGQQAAGAAFGAARGSGPVRPREAGAFSRLSSSLHGCSEGVAIFPPAPFFPE